MSMHGVNNEDVIDLSKAESREIRARSLRLLFAIVKPIRKRLAIGFGIVVVSQAIRAVGPALIAYGIDQALPRAQHGDWSWLVVVVGLFLAAAGATAGLAAGFMLFQARTNQAVILDLRQRTLC